MTKAQHAYQVTAYGADRLMSLIMKIRMAMTMTMRMTDEFDDKDNFAALVGSSSLSHSLPEKKCI